MAGRLIRHPALPWIRIGPTGALPERARPTWAAEDRIVSILRNLRRNSHRSRIRSAVDGLLGGIPDKLELAVVLRLIVPDHRLLVHLTADADDISADDV